jgi:hypothetical protein
MHRDEILLHPKFKTQEYIQIPIISIDRASPVRKISQTSPSCPKNPLMPLELDPSFIILSASPTCFRSETSLFFKFICLYFNCNVNPWAVERDLLHPVELSLMTANCYCRGSDELESLLRWRYTSVPYLQLLAVTLDFGSTTGLPFHADKL